MHVHVLPESFSPSCHLHRSDGKKICYHDMSWLTWNIYQCLGQLGEVAWRKMFLIDLALVINSRFYIEVLNPAFNFNFSSMCLCLSLLSYFHYTAPLSKHSKQTIVKILNIWTNLDKSSGKKLCLWHCENNFGGIQWRQLQ